MQSKSILFLILFYAVGSPNAFAQTADELAGHQCAHSDKSDFQCMVCALFCENGSGDTAEFDISTAIGRAILARTSHSQAKTVCESAHGRDQFHNFCKLPSRNSGRYGSLLTSVRAAKAALKEGPDIYCSFYLANHPIPNRLKNVKSVVIGGSERGMRFWECPKLETSVTLPTIPPVGESPGASDKPNEKE